MKHNFNKIWIYKFSGFIALLEIILRKIQKESIDVYLQLILPFGALNFHFSKRFQRIVYYMP